MGDPPKLRNKFEKPKRLWDADRLAHDGGLKKEFGLKCMRELWVNDSELRKYRREARRLLSLAEVSRKKEETKMLVKLAKIGILKHGSAVDDVLGLKVRDLLERRLQTLVVRKGLAKSMRQSRQLITHGFIAIEGRRIQIPGYIVTTSEEPTLVYAQPIDLSVRTPQAPEAKPVAAQVQS
jgi:small subunit ribosomal protein S4